MQNLSGIEPVDLPQRLQNYIATWRGTERNQTLLHLYEECQGIVGKQNILLPLRLFLIKDLDVTRLRHKLNQHTIPLQFRTDPTGRFDMALVPVYRDNTWHFVLAIEEGLSTQDQVALYAHAIAHLLHNNQQKQAGKRLLLDPSDHRTHTDMLMGLRYLESDDHRSRLDREVLNDFPRLREMIELPEESNVAFNAVTKELVQELDRAGWKRQYRDLPYVYTDGRVLPGLTFQGKVRRGRTLRIDARLFCVPSLPIAVIHVQRKEETTQQAVRRVREVAQRLALPFAFILDEDGDILELDFSQGTTPTPAFCAEVPDRETLLQRWLQTLQLTKPNEKRVLLQGYDQRSKPPRYYQSATINRAVIAVLQAQRGLRPKRILLTLATGTGKTLIAFHLLWKLRKSGAVRNVLYLADRGYLLDQARLKDFAPFGEEAVRGIGGTGASVSRYLVFASYQWLATGESEYDLSHYQELDKDYFDVILVDECHRGSASENSQWHKILEHFSDAIQIGMTATPLDTKDVRTNAYFGEALYTYSLSRGINDGYLAPYRVIHVTISPRPTDQQAQEIQGPATSQATQIDASSTPPLAPITADPLPTESDEPAQELDENIVIETSNTMRKYTQAIAEHLANYLQQNDPTNAKTIIFCVDNEHAHKMRKALEQTCAAWARPGDIVRIVDKDGTEGIRALDKFRSPQERKPIIVTTAKLLSTGIDIPTCQNIVLARGIGSIVEFKQIIGRGTRLFAPKKTWFTILDYSGSIKHFFDPAFDGAPESFINETLIPPNLQTIEPNLIETPVQDIVGTGLAPVREGVDGFVGIGFAPIREEVDGSVGTKPVPLHEEVNVSVETGLVPIQDIVGTGLAPVREEVAHTDQTDYNVPSTHSTEHTLVHDVHPPSAHSPMDNTMASTDTDAGKPISYSTKKTRKRPVTEENPPTTKAKIISQRDDGTQFVASGQRLLELGPDGQHLRQGTYRDFAITALNNFKITTPDELRKYWQTEKDRKDLVEYLTEQVVSLDALAELLRVSRAETDDLDLLLHAVFALPLQTREQRVEKLRLEHKYFFLIHEHNLLATDILHAILEKYIHEKDDDKDVDVSDVGLFKVHPLSLRGTSVELMRAFITGDGIPSAKKVLQELRKLLYSV